VSRAILPTGTRWTSDAGQVFEAREPMFLRDNVDYSAPARVCLTDGSEHATGIPQQSVPASWIDWSSVKAGC
jgi:hypothetical protein